MDQGAAGRDPGQQGHRVPGQHARDVRPRRLRPRRRLCRGPAALLGAGVLVAACNQHLLPETRTLGGRLILDQAAPVERGGGDCRGTGGYRDLRSGLAVRALDANGDQLATGSLLALPAPTDARGGIPEAERRRCVWSFTLPGLPTRPTYVIVIGERGEVSYSREELDAAGWNVEVALGG